LISGEKMPEEKEAPPSIDLGLFDDEEKPPPTVNLGIDGTLPLASMESEDDEESTESDESFSGSVSTTEPETASSEEPQNTREGLLEGKMNKKDFWLGVFAPIGLLILASSIYNWLDDGVSHYYYDDSSTSMNLWGNSGNFTIDTLGFGVDCNEDTYDFGIYYYDEDGNMIYLGDAHRSSLEFSCGEEWTIPQSDSFGYWEADGALNLSLPYAPENGTEVIVGWNNSGNTTSIGTGDGVRTNFSVDAGERHGGPFDEWTFIGKYEHQPVENGYHEVSVYKTSEGLWWHNENDVRWRLYWQPDSIYGAPVDGRINRDSGCGNQYWMQSGILWTGKESTYGEHILRFSENSFNGFCFNNEFYTLIEGVEMGASYDHCSQLTVELVDDEGNLTDYWNGGRLGSCYSNMDNPESPESANEDAWSLILSKDVELVRNFGKDGPMSFQLPSGREDIHQIHISAYSESKAQKYQDTQQEARVSMYTLETSFTLLLVLGIPLMLIAAVATGHKWFTYGFLTGATVGPLIFVVACFGFFFFVFSM